METDFEVASAKQRRHLAVAVSEVQDDGERVVLLRVRGEEVDEEALPTACRTEDEHVSHVVDMRVQRVRRVVRGLEYGERLPLKVTAPSLARVEREQKAEIGDVRLEQGQSSQVVGAVSGDDAQPGVQEVVRFFEQNAVVDGNRLLCLGGLLLQGARIVAVQDERDGAIAEEVAVYLDLCQRISELLHRRTRRIVHEHLFGPRLRRHVVDDRYPLIEEVPAPQVQVSPDPFSRDSLPLETGNEFTRNRMELSEQVRERLRRRFLHRENLDLSMADLQTISVAFDGGIRHEIVHVRVVSQLCRVYDRFVVVDKFSEQSERVRFRQSFETDIT